MNRILALMIGYLFGMIEWSLIVGRLCGVDIRRLGDGNTGTANVFRNVGKKAGSAVMVLDIAKAAVAVWLAGLLAGEDASMRELLKMYGFAGAVLGHDFPFYLRFRGGKGSACFSGFLIFHHFIAAVPLFIVFCATMLLTHFVAFAFWIAYAELLVYFVVAMRIGLLPITGAVAVEFFAVYISLMALTLLRHRANIARMFRGTEHQTYFFMTQKGKRVVQ